MISDEKKLNEILEKYRNKSILLGNGFNLSLGVDTSYESLFKSLLKSKSISDIIDEITQEKIKNDGYNLERNIEEIKKDHHGSILDKFYEIILKKGRRKIYKYNNLIEFLIKFNRYFTVNYDPLLYRYLLMHKEQEKTDQNKGFYEDIKNIHSGYICFEKEFNKIPLKAVTKKQVYEIASKIFKEGKKYKDKKMEDYYNILRDLRSEKKLTVNDGFTINPKKENSKKYRVWDNSKRNEDQNIFYLHGALHIYSEESKIKKVILKKGSKNQSFINEIISQFEIKSYSCIFSRESSEKLKYIKNNKYLKSCLESLKASEGLLMIIGWSASEEDKHLIKAIKESKVEKILISYHDGDQKSKKRLEEVFKKPTILFEASILPFFKNKKKKEKEKEKIK